MKEKKAERDAGGLKDGPWCDTKIEESDQQKLDVYTIMYIYIYIYDIYIYICGIFYIYIYICIIKMITCMYIYIYIYISPSILGAYKGGISLYILGYLANTMRSSNLLAGLPRPTSGHRMGLA